MKEQSKRGGQPDGQESEPARFSPTQMAVAGLGAAIALIVLIIVASVVAAGGG